MVWLAVRLVASRTCLSLWAMHCCSRAPFLYFELGRSTASGTAARSRASSASGVLGGDDLDALTAASLRARAQAHTPVPAATSRFDRSVAPATPTAGRISHNTGASRLPTNRDLLFWEGVWGRGGG